MPSLGQVFVGNALISYEGNLQVTVDGLRDSSTDVVVTFAPRGECHVFPANFQVVGNTADFSCLIFEVVTSHNVVFLLLEYESHSNNETKFTLHIGNETINVLNFSTTISQKQLKDSCPTSSSICRIELRFKAAFSENIVALMEYEDFPVELVDGMPYTNMVKPKDFIFYLSSGQEPVLFVNSMSEALQVDFNVALFSHTKQPFPEPTKGTAFSKKLGKGEALITVDKDLCKENCMILMHVANTDNGTFSLSINNQIIRMQEGMT